VPVAVGLSEGEQEGNLLESVMETKTLASKN
jgi:hypothetical protein